MTPLYRTSAAAATVLWLLLDTAKHVYRCLQENVLQPRKSINAGANSKVRWRSTTGNPEKAMPLRQMCRRGKCKGLCRQITVIGCLLDGNAVLNAHILELLYKAVELVQRQVAHHKFGDGFVHVGVDIAEDAIVPALHPSGHWFLSPTERIPDIR